MEKIVLSEMPVIINNEHAALLDIGDGIACFEFRSKSNSITKEVRELLNEVLDNRMDQFNGLVIGNQSKNFSVGANLNQMKENIVNQEYDALYERIGAFQSLNQKIKYYNKPIVAAPYRLVLGGGLEVVMHCHSRVALNKTYMGLVEIGVGLIPGGGGIKESLVKATKDMSSSLQEASKIVFSNLILRKVSKDAYEAKKMKYLNEFDSIIEEKDMLISTAKDKCLKLVREHNRVKNDKDTINVLGQGGYSMLMELAEEMYKTEKITPYDYEIAKTIANIICGENIKQAKKVNEDVILKGEQNGFISQCKKEKTLERINHLLETGKLLQN